jgi:chromosome segregation ATPase
MTQEEINDQIESYQNKLAELNTRLEELSNKEDITEEEKEELRGQINTAREEIDGITKEEFILNEQDILYTILGTTSALIFVYNKIEQYELSADLHKEIKKSFCLIYDEVFPKTNNEHKFHELMDKMFETYKQIFQ